MAARKVWISFQNKQTKIELSENADLDDLLQAAAKALDKKATHLVIDNIDSGLSASSPVPANMGEPHNPFYIVEIPGANSVGSKIGAMAKKQPLVTGVVGVSAIAVGFIIGPVLGVAAIGGAGYVGYQAYKEKKKKNQQKSTQPGEQRETGY